MLTSNRREDAVAARQRPSPFIEASPSPSPTHAAKTATGTTTTIHMDSADDDEGSMETTSSSFVISSSQLREQRSETQQHQQQRQQTASPFAAPRQSLTTYQLASAALRRLPGRSAPSGPTSVPSSTAEDAHARPASLTEGRDLQGSKELQGGCVEALRDADHSGQSMNRASSRSPLRATVRSGWEEEEEETHVPRTATLTPATSPGRFRVPPPPSHPVSFSATAAAAHTRSASSPSLSPVASRSNLRTSSEATHSAISCQRRSPQAHDVEDDEEEEEEEEAEEDVAARVLSSLRQKDDTIRHLTHAISQLRKENDTLRHTSNNPRGLAALSDAGAARDAPPSLPDHSSNGRGRREGGTFDATPEAQRVRRGSPTAGATKTLDTSPSLPPTPVRWWKSTLPSVDGHPTAAAVNAVDEEKEEDKSRSSSGVRDSENRSHRAKDQKDPQATPSHALDAAHAAVETLAALQEALAEKEAELADVRAQLSQRHHEGDAQKSVNYPSSSVRADDADESSAATSMLATIEAAQARAAQLEYQLDTLQEGRREDQRTMREHIDHLTRELHSKSKELRRQERQHKLELTGLQREVTALADQLEDQLRAATAVSTSSVTQHDVLQRQLAEARQREEQLIRENTAAQQQWFKELEEQKQLVDAAREEARQAETQAKARSEQESALLRQLTHQQQQMEAQVHQWRTTAAQAQRELAELRSVHQRTEESVAVLRTEAQALTESLASATLQQSHEEQRAQHLEGQVQLLSSRLRHMEEEAAALHTEVDQLRQEQAVEVEHMLSEQDEEHRKLLRQVEGCVKGSEAVESALLKAEASRREVATQLTHALAERDEYHRQLRENSVQTHAQLLEQQQLFSDGQDALQQRWQAAQHNLVDCTNALETTQRELHSVRERMQQLEAETKNASDTNAMLSRQLRDAEDSTAQQTARLVKTTESLKEALQAQLQTTTRLKRTEQQRRALQEAAQWCEERQAQERVVLQRIVALLQDMPESLSRPMTSALREQKPFSVRAHAARRSSETEEEEEEEEEEETEVAAFAKADDFNGAHHKAAARELKGPPTRSSSSTSSSSVATAAESVLMSADATVSPAFTSASSLTCTEDEAAELVTERPRPLRNRRLRSAPTRAAPAGNGSKTKSAHTTFAVPRQAKVSVDQSGLVTREGLKWSVLRTLNSLHDTVQQLLAAHSVAQGELSTKRTAVRTLLRERKAQQRALEAARTALDEQRSEAEKRQKELTKFLRTEAADALKKALDALNEQHAVESKEKLEEEQHQHMRQHQRFVKRCVHSLGVQLLHFVRHLPNTLHNSVGGFTMPAQVEPSAREVEEMQRWHAHQRASWAHPQPSLSGGGDAPYREYENISLQHFSQNSQPNHWRSTTSPQWSTSQVSEQPWLHPYDYAGAESLSHRTPRAVVAPEVQAECDQIARDVLGLAGGWSDLTCATAAVDTAAPPAAFPPPPPAYADAMPFQDNRVRCSNGTWPSGSAPVSDPQKRSAKLEPGAPVEWPDAELQELKTVLEVYLTQMLARLSREADVVSPQHNNDANAASTSAGVSAWKSEPATKKEEDDVPALAMGLRQWMTSLRRPNVSLPDTSPQESVRGKIVSDSAVHDAAAVESYPLASWMNLCVAHVVECALRNGAVHVME